MLYVNPEELFLNFIARNFDGLRLEPQPDRDTDHMNSQHIDSLIERSPNSQRSPNPDKTSLIFANHSKLFAKIRNKIDRVEERVEQRKRYGHW